MEKFKEFILSEYQGQTIHIRRKAFYAVVFAIMLLVFIGSAAVIDIAANRFTILKAIEFGIYVIGIVVCYFLFQFGHLEVTGNIFIFIGFIRTFFTYFVDRSMFQMIIITMISLLITAVIHIKRYQVIVVYIFFVVLYMVITIVAMIQFSNGLIEMVDIGDKIYGFIAVLIYMAMCSFVIRIINAEIKRSAELETARATSMLYFEEMEKLSDRLEEMAITDKLTGILNRRRFDELLSAEIEKSNRYNRPLALLMMDLDYFKNVNDEFGHSIGDQVLKEFVEVVAKDIRKTDYFIRWGGEEFIVIIPELDLDHAVAFGEKLRETVNHHKFDVINHITVSIGVVIYKSDENIDNLIKRLDKNLYYAKEHGRNQVIG